MKSSLWDLFRRRKKMTRPLKPLPHAVIDYVFAAKMMAAPWLFGFSRNKAATMSSIGSGAAILELSLMTRYPLGAVKLIPFPTHGVIEASAGIFNIAAPWLMGFAGNKRAKWLHVISGLSTLAVVAMTDYQAAESTSRRESRPAIEEWRESYWQEWAEPEAAEPPRH
jgi:hypothetical protein